MYYMYPKLRKKANWLHKQPKRNYIFITIFFIILATFCLYISISQLSKENKEISQKKTFQNNNEENGHQNAYGNNQRINIVDEIVQTTIVQSNKVKLDEVDEHHLNPLKHEDPLINLAKYDHTNLFMAYGLQGWTPNFTGPTNHRQRMVRSAMGHAWAGYSEYAWGWDELKPLTKAGASWFGLGLTIVDSLDTLLIMGMTEEYEKARNWTVQQLNFDGHDQYVNLFEVTIRVLGGLLSAYHLSGQTDTALLDMALDLGERLSPAFQTPTGIPYSDVNLKTRHAKAIGMMDSSTSEVASLQLEFIDLGWSTNLSYLENYALRITDHIHALPKMDGLVPIFISPRQGNFQHSAKISLGARGDSYYEYLLKQWVQVGSGPTKAQLARDYIEAIAGVQKHLIGHVIDSGTAINYTYVAELYQETTDAKMDHLVCFLPGTLAYGLLHGIWKADPSLTMTEASAINQSHWLLAAQLTKTCYQMYESMETGLSPEIVHFGHWSGSSKRGPFSVKFADTHNLLRPETVESLWYMYELTKDKIYQEWGWKIFNAFEKYTKVQTGGYSSIDNVLTPLSPGLRDRMESYFLAETLKYLYLLFQDGGVGKTGEGHALIPLQRFVFNTEGHPLPILENKHYEGKDDKPKI